MRISDWSSDVCSSDLLEVALHEYLPFTILLLSLFTIAGGVRIVGNLHGSPSLNTGLLAAGTVLASWMGTTGAAMLLVRPLLNANDNRHHRTHVFVFLIFLVANVGGALTPLGDTPLFLGFLQAARSEEHTSELQSLMRITYA